MAKRKLAQRGGGTKKAQGVNINDEDHQQQDKKLEEEDDKQEHEEVEQRVQPKKVSKRPRKPEPSVPEYFEEKRNFDLWKEVFPVGTEWDQLHLVYQYNWDFTNLENAFEEGGELHGKRVYLFGCTEPQMVPFKGEMRITHVPVVVVVVSSSPPSNQIGIKSVQREAEEIVPMKSMKMEWYRYTPLGKRDRIVERLKSNTEIFYLGCTQRRLSDGPDGPLIDSLSPTLIRCPIRGVSCPTWVRRGKMESRTALRHLKEERVKKFEYCLPYFYNPLKEDEYEQSTVVTIMYEQKPKLEEGQEEEGEGKPPPPPVVCDFDWEFDELEEFTDKLIEEEVLPADQKDDFKDFVKEKVREAKKAHREAREARKKAIEEMSAEKKAELENIKFCKFYPLATLDTPDISGVKSSFINWYYGKAHKVL